MAAIKEQWTKFKEWWRGLEKRERQMLAFGGSVVAIFLLYQIIWSPMLDRANVLRKKVDRAQANLVWMQQADKQLKDLPKQTASLSGVSLDSPAALLGFLQGQLDKAGLTQGMTQLKQADGNAVLLQFKSINFDRLTSFLIQLTKSQPVSVRQMTVRALKEPGMVSVDLTLVLKN